MKCGSILHKGSIALKEVFVISGRFDPDRIDKKYRFLVGTDQAGKTFTSILDKRCQRSLWITS